MNGQQNAASKKKIKQIHTGLRAVIQLLFFIAFPSVYTAAFSGVTYIFTQMGAGEMIGLTSFVTMLAALCLYTVLFGRFFCGFACAFGTLGDAVHALYVWLCKRIKKRPAKIPERAENALTWIRYVLLALIAALCFLGVYEKLKGTSPWVVFSMLRAGNPALTAYLPGVGILMLILIGMCVQERFFCRNLCPMGAVFSLLPVFPFFALHRDRASCIKGCRVCEKTCPSKIGLPPDGSPKVEGDCLQCQKCIDTCPKGNIHTGVRLLKGNEVWFTILRALILAGILLWLGA